MDLVTLILLGLAMGIGADHRPGPRAHAPAHPAPASPRAVHHLDRQAVPTNNPGTQ